MTAASPSGEDRITGDKIRGVENARAAYGAIADWAQSHNALQWQTPALALTAEAFLLQIALGPQSTPPAQLVASALNFMLSLLCIQLMWKHRAMQIDDRMELQKLEERLGLPRYHRKPDLDGLKRWQRLLRTSSTRVWSVGFAVLALVALGIFVVTLVRVLGCR
jgi:hypothetical protein